MFSAFIIALREGFEIAIAVSILIIYLRKTERRNLLPAVGIGIVSAAALSIAAAIVMNALLVGEESLEGPFYLLASALVISMIVWMWRTSMQLGVQVTRTVDNAEGKSLARTKLAVGGLAFVLVFREGIELVIFLLAISSSTQGGQWALAALAGIVLSVALCAAVVRGMLKVNIQRFFKASAVVLIIFVAQLLNGAAHEFIEHNWIPNPGGSLMAFIDWAQDSNVFAGVAVAAFLGLIPYALFQAQAARRKRRHVGGATVSSSADRPNHIQTHG